MSPQNIVNRCYDSPTLDNQFCALISRNDDTLSAQSGGLDYLRQVQLNFGAARYKGTDVSAKYATDIAGVGVQVGLNWTHVNRLDLIESGTGSEPDIVDPELGEMRRPEDSAVLSLNVGRANWDAGWRTLYYSRQTLTYEDGVEIETVMENFGPSAFTPKDTFVHDVSGSWNFGNILLYGGVNNVTDVKPYVTERAYPVSPVGRFMFVGLKYTM